MILYVLSGLSGYVLGSFPTAYLFLKARSKVDITKSGSGNVGAYNAGVVTGSKRIGIIVGVTDGLKGLAAVLVASFWMNDFWSLSAGLLGAVLGHNYSVWLKFKGGRGLATACGAFFAVGLSYTLVWCTLWAVLKWQRQSVLTSNVIAIIATPVILFAMPSAFLEGLMITNAGADAFRLLALFLSLLLLVSHRDVVREHQEAKE